MTLLSRDDAVLFFKLLWGVLAFVNRRCEVLTERLAVPEELGNLPDSWLKVRDALLADISLIDRFVEENPDNLADDELEIVGSWRHRVVGSFFVIRYLKNCTVFLASGEDPIAYGSQLCGGRSTT